MSWVFEWDATRPIRFPLEFFVRTLFAAFVAFAGLASVPAQTVERTNPVLPDISTVIRELAPATGWTKDDSGTWRSLPKAIPYLRKNRGSGSDEKLGASNYTSIELRTVTIDGKVYPALAMKRNEGSWKYPTIKKDFFPFERQRLFVFHSWPTIIDESRKDNESYIVDLRVYTWAGSGFGSTMAESLGEQIQKKQTFDLEGRRKEDRKTVDIKFSLLVFPVTDKGVRSVRFIFYTNEKDSSIRNYNALRQSDMSDFFGDEEFERSTKEFDRRYFEMPREAFLEFFGSRPSEFPKPDR